MTDVQEEASESRPTVKPYATVRVADGLVTNVSVWDGVEPWEPPEDSIAIQSDTAQIGWTYADGQFTAPLPPKPTVEEVIARNTQVRDSLLVAATLAIDPLQDAVDLDDATSAEISLLKKWKQYRVAVNRLDITLADVAWPASPA